MDNEHQGNDDAFASDRQAVTHRPTHWSTVHGPGKPVPAGRYFSAGERRAVPLQRVENTQARYDGEMAHHAPAAPGMLPPADEKSGEASTESKHSVTKRTALSSLLQVGGKLSAYALAVVSTTLLARSLSVTAYGHYVIIITFVLFIQPIADAGIRTIGIREAAQYPEYRHQIVGTTLSLNIISSVIAYGTAAILMQFLPYPSEVKVGTIIVAISAAFLLVGTSLDVVFQPAIKMQIPAAADLAAQFCTAVAMAALFALSQSLQASGPLLLMFAIGIYASTNVLAFLIRWVGASHIMQLRLHINLRHWRYLLSMAAPMALLLILGQIHLRADLIILSLMRPAHDVAIYGLASKIVETILTVPSVLLGTVFPILARYARSDVERFKRTTNRVISGTIALALPMGLGLVLLAPGVTALVGGNKYPQSALPLRILAGFIVVNFFGIMFANIVIIFNRQGIITLFLVFNTFLNVILNVLLIPHYSYVAASAITDLTGLMDAGLAAIFIVRVAKLHLPLDIIPKVVISCIVMGAVVLGVLAHILTQHLILSTLVAALAGALVYFLVLFALGGIDEGLVSVLFSRIKSRKSGAASEF